MNNYEVAEIVEIGKAQDVILGDYKAVQIVDDSPEEGLRNVTMQDDE
jgi:hypothetical protein